MDITVSKFKVSGMSLPIKQDVAGKTLSEIYRKHDKKLTAEIVVKEAKPKSHPLHPCFEWNNVKAGREYRLQQARNLIRCVKVEVGEAEDKKEYRAFVNVSFNKDGHLSHNPFDRKKSYYVSVSDAMANSKIRNYTIEQALIELERWKDKYAEFSELASLFEMIDVLKKKFRK